MNAPGKFPAVAEAASPAPRDLVITPRDVRFAREGKARWWLNGDPVASAWHDALSATFPRGEAFFVESVKASFPFYVIRLAGGLLYLGGMCVMLWNTVMTVRKGRVEPVRIPAAQTAHA